MGAPLQHRDAPARPGTLHQRADGPGATAAVAQSRTASEARKVPAPPGPETAGAALPRQAPEVHRPPAARKIPPGRENGRGRVRVKRGPLLFSMAVAALLIFGWSFPTERYITPHRGVGYALGIAGGSMMLLLLLYSARKRVRWLKFLGPTVGWFRYHMILGVLGPLCILYHANFGLGAANSNVALFSMLTVAGSGLVGRYIYARIHHGLYGSKTTLQELREGAEGLRAQSGAFAFLPELVSRLEAAEQRVVAGAPAIPLLGIPRLVAVGARVLAARLQLRSYVRRGLREAARHSSALAGERRRLQRSAYAYIDRRLAASRRVAGFQAYERLFSLWHALHLPLIFMMLAAGVVHVVAVHIY